MKDREMRKTGKGINTYREAQNRKEECNIKQEKSKRQERNEEMDKVGGDGYINKVLV